MGWTPRLNMMVHLTINNLAGSGTG